MAKQSDEVERLTLELGLCRESLRHSDLIHVAARALFKQYAEEANRPHVGDYFKEFTATLLRRATEAGVYE